MPIGEARPAFLAEVSNGCGICDRDRLSQNFEVGREVDMAAAVATAIALHNERESAFHSDGVAMGEWVVTLVFTVNCR